MCPVGQPASRLALPVDEIPGLRLARIRGRGDRVPPRKSPFASFPGLPRKAILACIAHPRRGGLRTPASETSLSPGDRSIRPPGVPLPSMIMLCLGLRTASQHGRGDRAPPRKPPSALFQGFPPRPLTQAWPPRRGGLCTPASETPLSPGDRPIRPPGVPLPSMIMLCLGLRTASQSGRKDRAPPRKRPSAFSPGLPRKAFHSGQAPWRGGLCTPARNGLGLTDTCPH